jgi:hypothetical protein
LALNLEQDGSTNSTIMDELNDITWWNSCMVLNMAAVGRGLKR